MTNFIPIFPLGTVAYPDEAVNLHIFEPRYIQMIHDIKAGTGLFGIIPVIQQQIQEMGTCMELLSIEKTYPGGEMDIKTRGVMVFRCLDIIQEIPDKLYQGAIVNYPKNERHGLPGKQARILLALRRLHVLTGAEKNYNKPDEALRTYDIAHQAGLSLQEEYELLCLLREDQRQEYLERHFYRLLPQMLDINQLKSRIERNGHFRKISVDSID
ncbi:MAG: LON peptidase substrate-binding domain-containing protein [Chitinophagaceae bacterium]